jgi:hypothetical protein
MFWQMCGEVSDIGEPNSRFNEHKLTGKAAVLMNKPNDLLFPWVLDYDMQTPIDRHDVTLKPKDEAKLIYKSRLFKHEDAAVRGPSGRSSQ